MNNLIFEIQRFAQIYGTDSDDNIVNDRNNVTINALAGNDTVDNIGSNVAVYGGTGNDSLHNNGSDYSSRISNITLDGGDGNDYISNNSYTSNVLINGGNGRDYIRNYANNVTINAGADNDYIYNSGNTVSIGGDDGNDTINNSYGNNVTIDGGIGSDIVSISSSTSVTAFGGYGDDTIVIDRSNNLFVNGGAGNDSINIAGANDNVNTIVGGYGNDTITGGRGLHLYQYTEDDGNDLITDFNANDTLQIGDGFDTYSTVTSGNDLIVNVGNGSVTLTGAASLSTVNIIGLYNGIIDSPIDNVYIAGTSDADTISNSGNNVTIQALGGDDYIDNSGNYASISGGAGNDTVYNNYSGDYSFIDGGTGDDYIYSFDEDYSTINGGDGNDTIQGNYWSSSLNGGSGNDLINVLSGGSDNTINGGDGDDTISNNTSYALIDGGSGNDSINVLGGGSYNTITAGTGDDTISNNTSYAYINGGTGNDLISLGSYASNNLIHYTSGDGNDVVHGFNETSTLQIGDGFDTYSTVTSGNDLIVNVGDGSITLKDAANLFDGGIIENTINNAFINGTSDADTIINSGNNVTIQALGGNDTITNNGSNVLIDAGEDDDSVSIGYWDNKSVGSNVTVNLGAGDDSFFNQGFQKISVSGGAGNDYIDNNALSGVEYITPDNSTLLGGAGDDTIINAGVNTSISGGTGDDYIDNWGNDVIIDSGEGNDSIWSSGDYSSIDAGNGDDYIYNYGDNSFIDGGAGDDYIYSYDEDYSTINGGDGNDAIQGNYWNSSINGGTGNDSISLGSYASNNLIQYTSGDGNDIVHGFNETSTLQIGDGTGKFESVVSGSDIIVTVGDGSVTLTDAAGLSAVNILGKETVSGPKTLYLDDSDKSPVTLSSDYQHTDASARVKKAIKIAGNELDNSIIGGAKNDSLVGKDGNDTLIGGLGNDTFTGGIGNDVFVYIAGNDVVTDYVSGQDTIKFESAITNVSVKSSDVIFTTDDGKITVKNSKDKTINYIDLNGNSSVYPKNGGGEPTVNGTTVTIPEDYDENIFYAADYDTKIKTIDASATAHDLEIFANEKIASKIIGGDGDNILHGSTKNDTFTGGIGNDIFVYSGGNDTITDYTEDEDIIDIESGAIYDKASVKGNDVIFTVGKNKITVKDSADKTITFSDGTTWDGGGGSRVITLTNSDPSPYILGAKIETVDGTKRTKAIEIFGNDLDNSIVSGSKNDSIYGGDGDDTLDGGKGTKGNDTLTGGDGNDLFIYTAGKDVITDYNEDEDIISLAAGTIKTASAEGSNVVFKIGSGTLTVNDAAGKTLSMIDADGNEFSTVIGGGVDTLKIVTNDDPDLVKLAFEVEVVDATERTKYDVTIEGNAQNNSIVGGSKNDSLFGAAGDDTLDGGKGTKGNDTLTGGDGNDVFVYTAGNDVITDYETGDKISTGTIKNASAEGDDVVFKIGSGTLTVNDAAGKTLSMIDSKGNEYSMIIGGSEEPPVSLNVAGTAVKIFEGYTADSFDAADYGSKLKTIDASATTHDFEIIGNGLANSIIGGSGDNILIGGLGNDKLWGNEGNDTFIYENGDGKDVIFGFEDGDLLQITGDFSAKFNQSKNEIAFKVGSTSNAITLKEFDATTFNINGDSYQISGTQLVKK